MSEKGLHNKYRITKTDGTPVDPGAKYFVLRIDENHDNTTRASSYAHRIASRAAAMVWVNSILLDERAADLHQTAMDLKALLASEGSDE